MNFIGRLFNKAPSREVFAKSALATLRTLGDPNPATASPGLPTDAQVAALRAAERCFFETA